MARILAEAGETVHVLAQQWRGAPEPLATSIDGRLTVHRIPVDRPLKAHAPDAEAERALLAGLAASSCPTQLFSWQTARYVERLLATETIDLIEAQEWEAPLYYLQLRRALGLGPGQQPPILVHLHSPSEMIFHYNGWDEAACDFLPLVHLEEYKPSARRTPCSARAAISPARWRSVSTSRPAPSRSSLTRLGRRGGLLATLRSGPAMPSLTWGGSNGARGSSSGSTPRCRRPVCTPR